MLPHLISYLLSGVTGVIGIFNWFKLREAEKLIVANNNSNVWSWKAIDNFALILLGILWLSLVFFCQYFYEKGYYSSRLFKRFSMVTGIQLLLLFITYLAIMMNGR
jgi:hypothetical protein